MLRDLLNGAFGQMLEDLRGKVTTRVRELVKPTLRADLPLPEGAGQWSESKLHSALEQLCDALNHLLEQLGKAPLAGNFDVAAEGIRHGTYQLQELCCAALDQPKICEDLQMILSLLAEDLTGAVGQRIGRSNVGPASEAVATAQSCLEAIMKWRRDVVRVTDTFAVPIRGIKEDVEELKRRLQKASQEVIEAFQREKASQYGYTEKTTSAGVVRFVTPDDDRPDVTLAGQKQDGPAEMIEALTGALKGMAGIEIHIGDGESPDQPAQG